MNDSGKETYTQWSDIEPCGRELAVAHSTALRTNELKCDFLG